MSVRLDTPPAAGPPRAGPAVRGRSERPAARAFAVAWGANLLLGLLGGAAFVPVVVRLLESWRVSPDAGAHRVSILGVGLNYPSANLGAVIVLGLALLGAVVVARALLGIGQELRAARRLARRLVQLRPVARGGVLVIDDARAEAFCAGLAQPRVYVTTGALALLDEPSLDAVLAHERHHAERRDPLRLAASRVIARSLFFLPGVGELRRSQQLLAEVSADENAVAAAAGDRSPLARAMLSFSDESLRGGASGIDPARVDHLLGEPPAWRFPALIWLGAMALLALLVSVAILAGREAAGSATLDAPFLSAQPCILMLALVPAGIGLLAAGLGRRARR